MKMVIVEDRNEFEAALKSIKGVAYAVPILADEKQHPAVCPISLLIVQSSTDETWIFPFKHNDALSIPIGWISELTPSLWIVPNKKEFMHRFNFFPVIDYSSIKYMRGEEVDFTNFYTNTMHHMHNKFHNQKSLNCAIPIMHHIQYAEELINYMKTSGLEGLNPYIDEVIIPSLQYMEKSGIHVDKEKFVKYFGEKSEKLIHNDLVYSSYNPFTSTGRPSNTWGGVNYAALNKSDGSRECFTSRFGSNGQMVLIDHESFHLRLIADMINFTLPLEPIHEWLGKLYFEKDTLTEDEYNEGKRITFKFLYSDNRMDNPPPFFQAIYDYIDRMWEYINKHGVIHSEHSRAVYLNRIENPTPAKVFNYMVQLFETEEVMNKVERWKYALDGKVKTKIVLYTYDSLLLDYHIDDGKEVLLQTVEIMERGAIRGTYPVRVYYGPDYHSMKKLELQGEPHVT